MDTVLHILFFILLLIALSLIIFAIKSMVCQDNDEDESNED